MTHEAGGVDSVAYFEEHAEAYEHWFDVPVQRGHVYRARVAAALRVLGPGAGEFLDVGTGPGRLLEAAALAGWRCTGVDSSPRMLELAGRRLAGRDVRLLSGRVEELPVADASFDAVALIGVLERLDDPGRAVGELARVARPGGMVLVSIRHASLPRIWRDDILFPSARAAKRLVPVGHAVPAPTRPRLGRRGLERMLRAAGLEPERDVAASVCAIPDPFDRLAPALALRLSESLERRPRSVRALGVHLLVAARKPG